MFSPRRVTISPTGIEDADEFSQATYRWQVVERFEKSDDYFFIYTNPLAAIVVPKRAFADTPEFEEFIRKADEWRGQAAR